MTRAATAARALVLVLAGALAATAHADNELSRDDGPLPLAARVEKHLGLARQAAAAGDAERAAAYLTNACGNILYTGDPRTMAVCGEAQAAAAPYPVIASRLAGWWSCAVAWTLDWKRARELALNAQALGAGGPPGDTLAGEGVRASHLCLGAIAIEEGKYDEATRELDRFVALSEAAGDRGFFAVGVTWQCRVATATGDYARARALCERAEALAGDDLVRRSGALWQRGQLDSLTSPPAVAVATWERAMEAANVTGSPMWISSTRMMLADIYVQLGRLDDAARLLDAHDAELAARQVPDSYALQIAEVRGMLRAARGDHAGAIEAFDVAATSSQYNVALHARRQRAASLVALGRFADARASLEEAVARIEAARARTPEDVRRGYLDRHAEVFRGLAALEIHVGGPEAAARALAAAEAGRARALLDAIHASQQEAAAAAPNPAPATAAASNPAAAPSKTEPDAPALPTVGGPRRTPAEIQAALPPGHTLIVYVADAQGLFAIRVTREAIVAMALPGAGDRAALEERVRFFRDLVAEADDARALEAPGAALYRDLLGPIVGDRPAGTLIIAADGPLHALPFDALRVEGRFLAERADVVFTPSGSLLAAAARARAGEAVLAVGAPVLPADLPPLPAAADELRAIAAALQSPPVTLAGAGATEAAVRAALGGFRVLHVATHAVLDDVIPGHSGLVLSAAGDDDGRLRADEIYRLRFAGDVVVLSACRTGDGAASSSEGPLSLARAFLHAGAGAVVATLWDVDDRAGPAFMRELYRRLAAGRAVGVAVAETRRAMIARGAPPRTWAGYVTIGRPAAMPDLAAAAATPRPWRRTLALGLAAAGIAAIAAGLLLRRRRADVTRTIA